MIFMRDTWAKLQSVRLVYIARRCIKLRSSRSVSTAAYVSLARDVFGHIGSSVSQLGQAQASTSSELCKQIHSSGGTHTLALAQTHWLRTSQLTRDYQTHAPHPPTHTLAHAYHMSGCKRWSTCAHTCKPRASTSTHLLACCSR
jgi:hypothetical protein